LKIYAVLRELTKTGVCEATAVYQQEEEVSIIKTTLENLLEKMVEHNEQNSQVQRGMSDPSEREVKVFSFCLRK